MPDNQNTTQNPISEENSIPASPQEPTTDAPVPTTDSTPADMPLEAPESPQNADNAVSVNNDNPENSPVLTPSPEELSPVELAETPVNPASSEPNEPPVVSNPEPAETPTAQIPVNEPLPVEPEPIKTEPVSASQPQPTPAPVLTEPQQDKVSLARSLLIKARNAIQFRKRKKLDKIMTLFLKKSKLTNDEVEKFLHVSDATATRHLSQLEKEGKIKQTGKTGHAVSYSKI